MTIFSGQSEISRVYTSRFGNGTGSHGTSTEVVLKKYQVPGTVPSGKPPKSEPYRTVPCCTMQWKSAIRRLNRSVMRLKFRMLTIKQVVSQIRSEDWFRCERGILPHIHSSTSEVLEVRFQGQSIPILSSSIRACTLTPHFHKVCGCSPGSVATPGQPHTQLHRRFVDLSSI